MPADVADQPSGVAVAQVYVVEISTNGFAGPVDSVDAVALDVGEIRGQQALLHARRHIEFKFQGAMAVGEIGMLPHQPLELLDLAAEQPS